MGGEKWPVLVYGSTERNVLKQWILKFSLIDIHEFAESVRENIEEEQKEIIAEYSDEDIFDTFYEIEEDDSNRLVEFVVANNLIIVYFETEIWDEFSIGMEVPEFDNVTDEDKDKVLNFCERFELKFPTFYAGIVGEF